MITQKNVEQLFSETTKEGKELEEKYRELALAVSNQTTPNDLTREALLLLRQSLDRVKASLAMENDSLY